ncbi:hypothetical protein P171DRAFT_431633 [Karstenula rhodostoma CBS 690.94]|uniref:Uncharacterized protein n=1 Tax=Karstenula rhodostoma CBS 690.94 TaxID=1392251 RepID=A0A9P4PK94_9PLEO|nr:hypothetical protein P171DRAFT_431633 [Karstenula rhodostoma CBS 690.94]
MLTTPTVTLASTQPPTTSFSPHNVHTHPNALAPAAREATHTKPRLASPPGLCREPHPAIYAPRNGQEAGPQCSV